MRKGLLTALFHSKFGKLIPVLLIAGMMTTASATVFTYYYGATTATVQTADVQLVAGSDNVGGTVYPTATVTVAGTKDSATIGISFFRLRQQQSTAWNILHGPVRDQE